MTHFHLSCSKSTQQAPLTASARHSLRRSSKAHYIHFTSCCLMVGFRHDLQLGSKNCHRRAGAVVVSSPRRRKESNSCRLQLRLGSRAAHSPTATAHARPRPSRLAGLHRDCRDPGRAGQICRPQWRPTHPLGALPSLGRFGTIWGGRQSALTRCASLRLAQKSSNRKHQQRKKSHGLIDASRYVVDRPWTSRDADQ